MPQHTNRLINETSPYLRQHAHNPVDWYPWGEEALAKARAEDKPILLSIGYSACHWCHVMEHESFEDEETARLMNEHFVSIKVDREERPDIDHIYMSAVQMLTGHGGWPLTAFLTPEGKPFFGGTYFPPVDRHGLPAFRRVLLGIAQAYRAKSDDVQRAVEQLMNGLQRDDRVAPAATIPDAGTVGRAADTLAGAYDATHGGIGQAPKFPNTAVLELFLRAHMRTKEARYLEMVTHTLRQMARGGIYDQLGGGFHRYSVDQRWLVPHFEKMLYDNAQLVPLYLAAYQLTGDAFFATIAREVLDYVAREMRDPAGGFYSTQDADSEGEEGKFFLWDEAEVQRLLGNDVAEIVSRYWDITDVGNFEHRNILHVTLEIDQLAKLFRREADDVRRIIAAARQTLFAAREQRIKPGRDDKVLTAWNGLMISAFARAAAVLDDARYRQIALEGVAFVQRTLQRGDRLLSTYKDGTARLNGHLDDYAFFVAALIDTFDTAQDRALLDAAIRLTDAMVAHFADAAQGGFYFTSDDHEQLIVRSKPSFDGSIPSGNSVAVQNLLRLSALAGRSDYLERAEASLRLFADAMQQQPFGYANMLAGLDWYADGPREIVLIGRDDDPAAGALLQRVRGVYLPNRTLSFVTPGHDAVLPAPLQGKSQVADQPTVYVCHRMTCSLPVTSWEALQPLLVH
jgi:uncharacterized protein YyaL (SSP411 family)